jgi:hypothetical protein
MMLLTELFYIERLEYSLDPFETKWTVVQVKAMVEERVVRIWSVGSLLL